MAVAVGWGGVVSGGVGGGVGVCVGGCGWRGVGGGGGVRVFLLSTSPCVS